MTSKCPHDEAPAPCRVCGSDDIAVALNLSRGEIWTLCFNCRFVALKWLREMLEDADAENKWVHQAWYRRKMTDECDICEREEAAERRALDAEAEAFALEDAYREAERLGFKVR